MYFSATSKYMLLGSRFLVGEIWEGVIHSAGLIASVRESTLMCLVVYRKQKNNINSPNIIKKCLKGIFRDCKIFK